MKLLGTVIDIHKEQVVKKKILDKAVLIKTFFIGNYQVLDLERRQLAYHIGILIVSMGYQNIFQLIIITHLKILKSLNKLAVRLGFHERLNITRLNNKI